jgi:hypothetical protein
VMDIRLAYMYNLLIFYSKLLFSFSTTLFPLGVASTPTCCYLAITSNYYSYSVGITISITTEEGNSSRVFCTEQNKLLQRQEDPILLEGLLDHTPKENHPQIFFTRSNYC